MTDVLTRTAGAGSGPHGQAVAPRRPADRLVLGAVSGAILAAAPLVLWACQAVHPPPLVHDVALFVHLGALILGFGAVLSVDWVAALYLLGRRSLLELVRAADNAAAPIWAGYAGLVLSGLLLEADPRSPVTAVKLALVLVLGLNGVLALGAHRAIAREADPRWMAIGGCAAAISQLCWWGATTIGFINAH